jgi:hypothetical protein
MMICERILKLRQDRSHRLVSVRLFLPAELKESWGCRWEIHWPDRMRRGEAFGHDGMQAVVLALQAIGSELYASDEHASGQLSWAEGRSGYGFPVPRIIRGLLVGDDAEYL